MPVRDNLLYNSEVEVYANRGANGIDELYQLQLEWLYTKNHADNRRFSILP